jgi:hypothetical protein
MMVGANFLDKVLDWTRRTNSLVEFFFNETPYRVRIDKFIRAEDVSGNIVPWSKAFGTKKPIDVFLTFHVKRILVKREGKEENYSNLEEFLKLI